MLNGDDDDELDVYHPSLLNSVDLMSIRVMAGNV